MRRHLGDGYHRLVLYRPPVERRKHRRRAFLRLAPISWNSVEEGFGRNALPMHPRLTIPGEASLVVHARPGRDAEGAEESARYEQDGGAGPIRAIGTVGTVGSVGSIGSVRTVQRYEHRNLPD